jgi:hypothetical protein
VIPPPAPGNHPVPRPPAPGAPRFVQAVLGGNEQLAVGHALRLVAAGAAPEDVLLDLVVPALALTEHRPHGTYLTAGGLHAVPGVPVSAGVARGTARVLERVALALGSAARPRVRYGCVALIGTDGPGTSAAPAVLATLLRMRGFMVTALGRPVRGVTVTAHLARGPYDAAVVHCADPCRLPRAHRMVAACREAATPVMLAGHASGPGGRWARVLGADLWACGPEQAAERLVPGRGVHRTGTADLAHLADGEYLTVIRERVRLTEVGMDRLRAFSPRVRACRGTRLDALFEDLGRMADLLASAAYVDDAGLFADHVLRAGPAIAACGRPRDIVTELINRWIRELGGLPRAPACLRAGRTALALGT